jgi:hypothetical protein
MVSEQQYDDNDQKNSNNTNACVPHTVSIAAKPIAEAAE